jgi:hypothetical protein
MSQSSRSHALRFVRWREQAARLLIRTGAAMRYGEHLPRRVPRVETFDVHAAREHAESMIAMADEQAMFEDWCRAPGLPPPGIMEPVHPGGLGPENREPGAFVVSNEWLDDTEAWAPVDVPKRGGWPGKLARKWPGPASAAMGRSAARVGQRLLDMLDGHCAWAPSAEAQPSECQRCNGWGVRRNADYGDPEDCPSCHGTGHNLRGVVPPIEWSPQIRNRHQDALFGWGADEHSSWLSELSGDELLAPVGPYRRVVPRGEHRAVRPATIEANWTLEERINALGWGEVACLHAYPRAPRWRRGELRHADQRRNRP